jgi:hypothetical protein
MVWLRRNCRYTADFLTVRSVWKNTRPHEISTLQPNDAGFTAMCPGRFLGGSTPGSTSNPQPLVSYGVVNLVVSKTGLIPRNTVPDSSAANVNLWTVFEIEVDSAAEEQLARWIRLNCAR